MIGNLRTTWLTHSHGKARGDALTDTGTTEEFWGFFLYSETLQKFYSNAFYLSLHKSLTSTAVESYFWRRRSTQRIIRSHTPHLHLAWKRAIENIRKRMNPTIKWKRLRHRRRLYMTEGRHWIYKLLDIPIFRMTLFRPRALSTYGKAPSFFIQAVTNIFNRWFIYRMQEGWVML